MRSETDQIHRDLVTLGTSLGFHATREVSDSVLSLDLADALRPRVDLMWSLALSEPQSNLMADLLKAKTSRMRHLPIAGIEVEGTGPSTKTLTADVINILALGTRLGFLVVSEQGEARIYRRAVRIVRTIRRAYGDIGVIPLEAESIGKLLNEPWDTSPSDPPEILSRLPAGGERLPWGESIRRHLRELGEAAGFVVAEPYIPPILKLAWDRQGTGEMDGIGNPTSGSTYRMRKWKDFYTASQIDMAWLMPLPCGLRAALEMVGQMDHTLIRDGFMYPSLYDHVAVVGFEFESASGKHAGGGLANLAAYTTVGVAVSPTDTGASEIRRTLTRYQPTLGLRNVIVKSARELSPG